MESFILFVPGKCTKDKIKQYSIYINVTNLYYTYIIMETILC